MLWAAWALWLWTGASPEPGSGPAVADSWEASSGCPRVCGAPDWLVAGGSAALAPSLPSSPRHMCMCCWQWAGAPWTWVWPSCHVLQAAPPAASAATPTLRLQGFPLFSLLTSKLFLPSKPAKIVEPAVFWGKYLILCFLQKAWNHHFGRSLIMRLQLSKQVKPDELTGDFSPTVYLTVLFGIKQMLQ